MLISRSIALAVALLFGSGVVAPALAQKPADKTEKTDKTNKTGKKSVKAETKTTKKNAKAGTKTAKKNGKTNGGTASGGEKGNKGGETRGLDRADSVAGDHGAKGREVARGKQGK